ncbi:MAG: hypothetical protein JO366_18350 [Methylobacteriaceae bacterium]|nr:hypothetical protein [Methylobacteriaceae bacterium]MBV9221741.1 hypothetical protein [Methylobacteriaceae bacterium]MBV9246764.1 hypothetical protein [Methylobacteriaceae bacterium]MBV9637543.1 hypothetical protein [Methylobacteriaceae bacterium]MBV9701596.1 hypothetical protein [Methylobacteriaceae bacterium]
MKRLTLYLSLCLVSTAVFAETKLYASTLPCATAAHLVQYRGSAIVATGGATFDRIVRDASFCQRTQSLEGAFLTTADRPACFIGYRCRENDP